MKVMTLVGTRPEIIRLAAVLQRLDNTAGIDHVLVHTGQNWDPLLNDIFFSELGLRTPDHLLGVETTSLGATLGDVLRKTETVIEKEQPDAFLVLGDTNSALSLIMAKRMGVPTYHMEAGNRCFDANVPEEANRKLVDHSADFNLVYTEHARRNLLAEGIEPRRILLTGSPLREVLTQYLPAIRESQILKKLDLISGEFFLVSAHRQENVDDPDRLNSMLESLNAVARHWGKPVLVSTHPRTRKMMSVNQTSVSLNPLIAFHEPFGFLDFNQLQLNATCVLSDSGTISEESSMLGFPAVTLRSSIERPEALDAGAILMVDLDAERILTGIQMTLDRTSVPEPPSEYCISNTSERVVNFMVSTVGSHKQWSGIR